MITTIGQLMINEALPEEYRDYSRVMDKKTTQKVLFDLAKKHPEKYKSVLQRLMNVGQSVSTTGGFSYSLKDFMPSEVKKRHVAKMRMQVDKIRNNPKLSSEESNLQIVELLSSRLSPMMAEILEDSRKRGSRLADVVSSGSKGSPGQFNTTVGAPLLFEDHRGNPIPIPVFDSASEGLDPVSYFASAYGTRKGVISTKFATQDAGDFAKQLARSGSRTVVTEQDCGTTNGIMVDSCDKENSGAVMAADYAGVKTGTIIEDGHMKMLSKKCTPIKVRSPSTCEAEHGICAVCSGVRERGVLPDIGDNIGVAAGQTLSERLSQGSLNVKHQAGAASGKVINYGFEDVNRLFQMPKNFPKSSTVSEIDGEVKRIVPAAGGGAHVFVGDTEHWISDGIENAIVKVGDRVEAGDMLSNGISNPKDIARLRGIGEARRRFIDEVRRVTGNKISRRNAEVVARGLVSHVRVTDVDGAGGAAVGDIVRYDDLVRDYMPRQGSTTLAPNMAKGKYLERSIGHYTIGTRVTNRVLKDLKDWKTKDILVNDREPSFMPDVQRLYNHAQLDPDWMTRLGGSQLKQTLLKSVHQGLGSQEHSTSFVPALAKGIDFGKGVTEEGKF